MTGGASPLVGRAGAEIGGKEGWGMEVYTMDNVFRWLRIAGDGG